MAHSSTNAGLGHSTGSLTRHSDIKTTLSHLWTAFRNRTGAMVQTVQIGRMASVLNTLTDSQLDEIGIKRSDIYTYAKTLILTDGKAE